MGWLRLALVNHVAGVKLMVELPDDVPIEELTQALVEKLGFPSERDGVSIIYKLEDRQTGASLNDKYTLAENGVSDVGILSLSPVATALKPPTISHNSRNRKVFISYSRRDIGIAKSIYQFLGENGCNVWMDVFDLIPGQDWKLEIHQNIKSSDFFIACLSSNSVSKHGYVQKELKEAISILDEMPEGEIYIIPLRIDDCLVPTSLENKHWLDWSAPDAKEKLLRALNSKL